MNTDVGTGSQGQAHPYHLMLHGSKELQCSHSNSLCVLALLVDSMFVYFVAKSPGSTRVVCSQRFYNKTFCLIFESFAYELFTLLVDSVYVHFVAKYPGSTPCVHRYLSGPTINHSVLYLNRLQTIRWIPRQVLTLTYSFNGNHDAKRMPVHQQLQ